MSHVAKIPPDEIQFLGRMFEKDAKNYHVWSYRQWLVRHFSLWDLELPYVEMLLQKDVLNNSAWNHRWFVVFARHSDPTVYPITNGEGEAITLDIIEREIEYAKVAIHMAPQNQSPWNYLRGVLKNQGQRLAELKTFAEVFANVDQNDIRSSHALDFLADVHSERDEIEQAGKALDLLAQKYDPIRKNYWNYRRGLLGLARV